MPQREITSLDTESLTDQLNVVRSRYDDRILDTITAIPGRICVGGWWLDSSKDITSRSRRLRDDYSNQILTTENPSTWRIHFSPFGTSEKIPGTEKVAGAVGLLDIKRLNDKVYTDLSPTEQEKLVVQGNTNIFMANFLHYKLGLHVYKLNHREQLQTIVRSRRSNHSILDSLQTVTKKSHLAWITGPELKGLHPLWEKGIQAYQDHFKVKSETELAISVYQQALDIMGNIH